MANITVRNLDDDVKTRLRVRAAEHHRSMEERSASFCATPLMVGEPAPGTWRSSRASASRPLAAWRSDFRRVARCPSRRISPERGPEEGDSHFFATRVTLPQGHRASTATARYPQARTPAQAVDVGLVAPALPQQ